MSDLPFMLGMIAGLKVAKDIMEKSSTDSEVYHTIEGALLVLEIAKAAESQPELCPHDYLVSLQSCPSCCGLPMT